MRGIPELTVLSLVRHVAKWAKRRTILGEAGPYLTRYDLGEIGNTGHLYLHQFHRGDEGKDLHNHPWYATSLILLGGYREERLVGGEVEMRYYLPGDLNYLSRDTFHRIDIEEGECWTLFAVGRRIQEWSFLDVATGALIPWRDALRARGLL